METIYNNYFLHFRRAMYTAAKYRLYIIPMTKVSFLSKDVFTNTFLDNETKVPSCP